MDGLEKRLHNLEIAFVMLHALNKDLLPLAYAEDSEKMLQDFYDSSESLGGFEEATFVRRG